MAKHAAPTSEPAISIGMIVAFVAAAMGALVAFGVPLTEDQRESVLLLVAAAAPLVAGLLIRGKVTPAAEVVARTDPDGGIGIVAGPASELPTGAAVAVQQA